MDVDRAPTSQTSTPQMMTRPIDFQNCNLISAAKDREEKRRNYFQEQLEKERRAQCEQNSPLTPNLPAAAAGEEAVTSQKDGGDDEVSTDRDAAGGGEGGEAAGDKEQSEASSAAPTNQEAAADSLEKLDGDKSRAHQQEETTARINEAFSRLFEYLAAHPIDFKKRLFRKAKPTSDANRDAIIVDLLNLAVGSNEEKLHQVITDFTTKPSEERSEAIAFVMKIFEQQINKIEAHRRDVCKMLCPAHFSRKQKKTWLQLVAASDGAKDSK